MIEIQVIASSSKGNAYLLKSGGRRLLVECGLPYKQLREALKYHVAGLSGCLVSHSHHDHARSVYSLLHMAVNVYGPENIFNYHETNLHQDPFAHPAKNAVPFKIDAFYWDVLPFEGRHDVPVFGYQISDGQDTLVFITDTGYCRYTFDKMTVLMIEANFSEEILKRNIEKGLIHPGVGRRIRENHMSIERVVDLLKSNDLSHLREVRLLHLSSLNSDEDLFKRMIQKVTGIPVIVENETGALPCCSAH